jgi:flagellar hook-basal body complex protein FliE
MTNSIQGIYAYKKAISDYKGIKSSMNDANIDLSKLNVLRAGDNIELVKKAPTPDFPAILTQVMEPQVNKLRAAEKESKKTLAPSSDKASLNAIDLVGLVTAVNEAETALTTIVAVRDKFLDAYMKILNMPI